MNNKAKVKGIKSRTCYFFDDVININKFAPNKTQIDEN